MMTAEFAEILSGVSYKYILHLNLRQQLVRYTQLYCNSAAKILHKDLVGLMLQAVLLLGEDRSVLC